MLIVTKIIAGFLPELCINIQQECEKDVPWKRSPIGGKIISNENTIFTVQRKKAAMN